MKRRDIASVTALLASSVVIVSGCATGGRVYPSMRPVPSPALNLPEVEAAAPEPAPATDYFMGGDTRSEPAWEAPAPAADRGATTLTYTVKKGDCLSKIAARHGVRVSEILELNAISKPSRIRAGDTLVLPAHARRQSTDRVHSAPKRRAEHRASTLAPAADGTYTIRPDDTLGEIAAAHHTTVAALREANRLTGDRIVAGKTLAIPGTGASAPHPPPAPPPAATNEPAAVPSPASPAAPVSPMAAPAATGAPASAPQGMVIP